MAKSIVIVGAGGTMGFSIAREFGTKGFDVGLIARQKENLDKLASELAGAGVKTIKTRTADATKDTELQRALDGLRAELGSIDVLEYSPAIGPQNYRPALEVTPQRARYAFDLLVGGAVNAITHLLPQITASKGAFLFISGGAALAPIPPLASVGIASAGLRNYLTNLSNALTPQGVYVGAIYVNGRIQRGTQVDPDKIAAQLFDMYSKRDRHEETVTGPPPPKGPPPKS